MIVLTHRIPYKWGDTIKIKPIFDVHLGSAYCDVEAFEKFLGESDKKTYFIGGGDLLDSIVATDKRFETHADEAGKKPIVDYQCEKAVSILGPYRDQIIGLGRGNHEDVIKRRCGTDPINTVCQALDVPYLGYSGFVKLVLSENGSRGRTVIIKWHHGWGGGSRTQGADITKYAKDTAYWDADLFLYGHTHKLQWDVTQRLGLAGEKLIARPKLFAICGTFLKTFSNSVDATYSERAGYPPTTIGGVTINIKPNKDWVDMWI